LAPYNSGPYSMRLLPTEICERPGIPTSDAAVPSRIDFTGHSHVGESQLRRKWGKFEYRVDVYRVTNGAHIEHLYINFECFHAVFTLFHVCICNRFENTLQYLSPESFTIALYTLSSTFSYLH
jgi:hypothetical protein